MHGTRQENGARAKHDQRRERPHGAAKLRPRSLRASGVTPASCCRKSQLAGEGIRLAIGNPVQADLVTFGGLINRFLREALPERKGTADRYRSWILNHINPRWEAVPLSKVKPLAVEMWIKGLNLAPKSNGHVRSVMHILFEWAMRWELMEYNRNPMSLLKLKGLTKRVRQPRALSVEELQSLWTHLDEDTRTMSIVAASLGLRASECLGCVGKTSTGKVCG